LEQLVFELAPPEPPRLSNFLPGRNGELVAALARFAIGAGGDAGLLIWGAPGAGKTHLLHGAIALATEHGVKTQFHPGPAAVDSDPACIEALLVAIDRIDEADPAEAGRIFTLYNALRQRGGRVLAASRLPLATLTLREDLRTRLGWGLVYEALPLADDEKPEALAAYARGRGFDLSAEVIEYLLRHGRRDMPSLLAALTALDRFSLAAKRPITVPLLRGWLQASLRWDAQPGQVGRNNPQ
jgi:DnaA family protein